MRGYADKYLTVARLGAPILAGQLGVVAVAFADNIMIGRYSTEALASASFVNNVFNVINFCCMGFTYGVLPLAGALFGADKLRDTGAIVREAMRANTIYTLLLTVLMTLLYFNLHLLGQPEELLPTIRPYYLLYLAGLLPIAWFNVLAQWSYAIKNTLMPMWIILSANILNVVGNYGLIYGKIGMPELGLTGAGISTLAARVLSAAVIFAIFACSSRYSEYFAGYRAARVKRGRMAQVWRTSVPVSLQMAFESGSFSVAAIMVGWIGAVELAAYQVIVIVGTLGFCLYYAIGSATAVLVSNDAGRNDALGMRRSAWAGYHVMLILATCSTLIFIFFGRWLMHLFTPDMQVVAVAASLIFPLVLYQLGDATQITFANALRGTSHVMPMLWIAFVSYIVVGIPATYIFAFTMGLGIYGVVLSFSVSLFLAGALFLTFFLRTTRVSNRE